MRTVSNFALICNFNELTNYSRHHFFYLDKCKQIWTLIKEDCKKNYECSLFCNPNPLGSNKLSKMIMLDKQLKLWSNRIRCWMNIAFQLSLRSCSYELLTDDPIQIVRTIILHGNLGLTHLWQKVGTFHKLYWTFWYLFKSNRM